MTTFNATVNANSGGSQTGNQPVTIPAGVLSGDVVIVACTQVVISGTAGSLSAASTGTALTQIGSTLTLSTGSITTLSAAYYFVASSTDASKVITITNGVEFGFWSISLAAYTGAAVSSVIDVSQGQTTTVGSASVACPTLTTGVAGDWAVYLGLGAFENGSLSGPSGSTMRVNGITSSDLAAAIYDSNGSVGASGTSIGGGSFTAGANSNNFLSGWTIGLKPAPPAGTTSTGSMAMAPMGTAGSVNDTTPTFQATLGSTDGNGVQTWNVLSALNDTDSAGAQPMRILPPASPSAGYPHAFLLMLPVETGQGTSFGDSIGTAQSLSAQNTYNLTIVQPGFPISPWYGDNPNDPTTSQESFILALVSWLKTSAFATTGTEPVYLIGFSKSGLGGQGLQFRHPSLFAATACWDFPAVMTDYDGTDPDSGPVGGGSADVYGTSANFTTNYELDTGNLTTWKNASNFGTVNRIWIGGYSAFQQDVIDYAARLTSVGIDHTFGAMTSESHAWHTDWVAAGLAAIIVPNAASPVTLTGSMALAPMHMSGTETEALPVTATGSMALASVAIHGVAGMPGLGTPVTALVPCSFYANISVTAQATMEFENGAPQQGGQAALEIDPWISMYPG